MVLEDRRAERMCFLYEGERKIDNFINQSTIFKAFLFINDKRCNLASRNLLSELPDSPIESCNHLKVPGVSQGNAQSIEEVYRYI